MMKIYKVVHEYVWIDYGGDCNSYIPDEDVTFIFASKKDAEDFVRKYEDPHTNMDSSDNYGCSDFGKLVIKEDELFMLGEFDLSREQVAKKLWYLQEP